MDDFFNQEMGSNSNEEYTDLSSAHFFHNTEVFYELMVRLILLLGRSEAKKTSTDTITIEHNVEKTIFQINGLIPDETIHHFDISYRLSNSSLSYILHVFDINTESSGQARFYHSLKPFFNLFYFLNKHLEKHLGFSITKSIKDWDSYIKNISHVPLFRDSYILQLDLSKQPKLEIDAKSQFIKETNEYIRGLKHTLFESIKLQIQRLLGTDYENVLEYISHTEERDYLKMSEFLKKVDFSNINQIDFWLRITEFPYMDDIYFEEYECEFNTNVLNQLYRMEDSLIREMILSFRRKIDSLHDRGIEDYKSDKILTEVKSSF